MVPPAGDRTKRIPTMSWESVVDDAPENDASNGAPDDDATPPPSSTTASTTSSTSASTPLVAPAVHVAELQGPDPTFVSLAPITFVPLDLDPLTPEPVTLDPIKLDPLTLDPSALDPSTLDPSTMDAASGELMDDDAPARVRVVGPLPVIPAFGSVDIGPASIAGASIGPADTGQVEETTTAPISDELPVIVEATPVPDVAALADFSPRLPSVVQSGAGPATTVALADIAPAQAPQAAIGKQRTRRRSRRGLKLVLTFVVLGGLVAVGIVVGRPYLFPSDWDAAAEPYADAVVASRSVEFVEPLMVNAAASTELATRSAAELQVPAPDQQSLWRALGLSSGLVTDAQVAGLLDGWRGAIYSTADGQVYNDVALTGAQHDAQVTQSMAAAALDQEFAWSMDQEARTLDDQVATSAEVLRQARDVQLASTFDTPVDPIDPALVEDLPSVLGYRALAPYMFAEFANPTAGEANPLERIGTGGPGPFAPDEPVLASAATMIEGDVVATPPVALDRSVWFLTFAGFLDAPTAYAASEAIVENALTMTERGCAYATFSGSGVEETVVLRDALSQWSTNVPVEFASSFSVLDDGTLQLVSCDPGIAFEAPVNPAVHRALLSWRTAELATIEAVVATGSTDLEADLAFAWTFVVNSPIAADLAALPASTPPAEFAAAARAAVGTIFTPAT